MLIGREGQAVNKTANKVRFTHLPTGTQAASQQERERSKNRCFIALPTFDVC
jgi:protein subunit release factor B